MLDKNKIMILCKVVDNFGDIGVVYRLARALSDLRPNLELTLVVSNLESFHKMASQIDPTKKIQDFHYKNTTWKIVDWNLETESGNLKNENSKGASACAAGLSEVPLPLHTASGTATPPLQSLAQDSNSKPQFSIFNFQPSIILECFQCGRPDWLEEQLFAPEFTRTVQIIQIDYLTAEEYADEFHLLKSGTRKANIKKIFFMPGFTEKTAGLIINEQLAVSNEQSGAPASPSRFSPFRFRSIPSQDEGTPAAGLQSLARPAFKIFFFAYEDDCSAVVKGIADFQNKMRKTDSDFSVVVYLAEGKSSAPFEEKWKILNSPFKIVKIPFLQQEEFDYFITTMDFLFVRGEDSLARAALTGLPYIWQAYKQDENYQLVKVNALLERLKEYFKPEEFESIRDFWQSYNDYENATKSEPLTQMLLDSAKHTNTHGFENFAKKLHENGNLAEHLLRFIDSLVL